MMHFAAIKKCLVLLPANILRLLLLVGVLAFPAASNADVSVIVNVKNENPSLSREQIADLYFGRTKYFPNHQTAIVIDRERDDPLRSYFFQQISGFSISIVNAYWTRLIFSGQVSRLLVVENDTDAINFILRDSNAIAYVQKAPQDGSVRILMELKQ